MGSTTDKIKGRVKEAVGVITNNDRLKKEGRGLFRAFGHLGVMDVLRPDFLDCAPQPTMCDRTNRNNEGEAQVLKRF
jgi:hypothetical protein